MKQEWLLGAVNLINKILYDYGYKCAARQQQSYFSREGGKIGFTNMIAITLNFLARSTQTELNSFFEHVLKKTEAVSKQAYAEARFKLTVDAFKILYDKTAEYGSDSTDLNTFKGYRMLPIDGTTLELEDTYALRGYFGIDNGCAAARASVMCDVLNKGLILDAQLDKMICSEREFAVRHLARLKQLPIENPLLVFDRGYASADLLEKLDQTAFLFRLQKSFNAQIDHMPLGDFVQDITIKRRVFRLRVLKFKLTTGETEMLITNLPQKLISSADLKELYRLRWGVETAYHILKNVLQIENFSGTNSLVVQQDFYAAIFLKNMLAFAKLDSDDVIEQTHNPDNLYDQQTNENQLIGILKDKLAIALLETRPPVQAQKVHAIIQQAVLHPLPIRPGRHFDRTPKRKKRFHSSGKSSL